MLWASSARLCRSFTKNEKGGFLAHLLLYSSIFEWFMEWLLVFNCENSIDSMSIQVFGDWSNGFWLLYLGFGYRAVVWSVISGLFWS